MNAVQRFNGLLVKCGLDPETKTSGIWLQKLFNRLLPDYTPPKCLAGHDMNSHVLFMLILAARMFELLGERLGCKIEHLLAAVLLHNIDRIGKLNPGLQARRYVIDRFDLETCQHPFSKEAMGEIQEAVILHGEPYGEFKGSPLQRRLQQLDMLSRLNCFAPMAAAAQHGGNALMFDFDLPWLTDMEEEDRHLMTGHSIYTIQVGVVVNWYKRLPDEVRVLAKPFLEPYLAYLRAVGELIAFTTGGDDRAEEDLKATLGDLYV